jgi:3'-phosphoadenosine 5'-phosphosulfate sulfotransferase
MKHWNVQNKRFILKRDYHKVSYFAKKSAEMAKSATSKSKELSKSLVVSVKDKIDNLTSLISNMNVLFQRLPLPVSFAKNIERQNAYPEAEVEFEKGDFLHHLKNQDGRGLN